jgi:hypothetical protein
MILQTTTQCLNGSKGAPTICVIMGGTNDLRAFPVVEPGKDS